jgi:hypothetical protein
MNNYVGLCFLSCKGVRQGDPLSPLLFNFAADVLTKMVISAQNNGHITALVDNLIPKGIVILQYADGTIMCLEDDMEKARNVKILLYIYEYMPGLKINFEKSEVLLIGGDNSTIVRYA